MKWAWAIFLALAAISRCGSQPSSFDEKKTVLSMDGSSIEVLNSDALPAGGGAAGVNSENAMSGASGTHGTESGDGASVAIAPEEDPVEKGTENHDALSDDDLRDCGLQYSSSIKRIVVARKNNNIALDANTVLAIRIAGSHNSVNMQTSGSKIGGFCFVLNGNQPVLKLLVKEAAVGSIFYRADGNQSSGNIEIAAASSVDAMAVGLHGNQNELKVSGAGKFVCPTANITGNESSFVCGDE